MNTALSPVPHQPRSTRRLPARAELASRAAGLRHVDDAKLPGIRRRRTGKTLRQGKRFVASFVFEDPAGRKISDPATLERIRKLAIPPAWEEVWICPRADGHIQATGRDARGRKQYRYHARWAEERGRTKYSRMISFGKALPALRRQVEADLRLKGLPRRKVIATVVRLLETTFMRVGNEEYARTNKSFGLTTLKDRHVDFARGEVRFHFRGKSGVSHQVALHEPRVARIVRSCRDLPGQELFQYRNEDNTIHCIDSSDVNGYIREAAGADFTAKDFRTWAGTVLATLAFQELVSSPRALRAADDGRARRPSQRDVVQVIKQVAARLGNTPSVCRKCYVHPAVIASFLGGKLMKAMTPRSRGARAHHRGDALPSRGLRLEETAVLALLSSAALEGDAAAMVARAGSASIDSLSARAS